MQNNIIEKKGTSQKATKAGFYSATGWADADVVRQVQPVKFARIGRLALNGQNHMHLAEWTQNPHRSHLAVHLAVHLVDQSAQIHTILLHANLSPSQLIGSRA